MVEWCAVQKEIMSLFYSMLFNSESRSADASVASLQNGWARKKSAARHRRSSSFERLLRFRYSIEILIRPFHKVHYSSLRETIRAVSTPRDPHWNGHVPSLPMLQYLFRKLNQSCEINSSPLSAGNSISRNRLHNSVDETLLVTKLKPRIAIIAEIKHVSRKYRFEKNLSPYWTAPSKQTENICDTRNPLNCQFRGIA